MKKLLRILSLCMVMVIMASTLAACAPSAKKVAGVYNGVYSYNGSMFDVTIVLSEDGTYSKLVKKDGMINSVDSGDYETKIGKVVCETDGGSITYKYKNGTLENNGHVLYRQ